MSYLNYPEKGLYPIPKKNLLVLSCIDLRLTDNLLDFLHFDNLHNRYDHFALAGTSLLTTEKHQELFKPGIYERYSHWRKALFDHIQIAIDLHHIQDVYLIEHQDCGAYREFLKKGDFSSEDDEQKAHKRFAKELAKTIKSAFELQTHCFFIDLRGNVNLLYTTAAR